MKKFKTFEEYKNWLYDDNEKHFLVTGEKIPLTIDISSIEEEFICCKELYRQMKKKNISMKCKLNKYDICPEIQDLYNENKKLKQETQNFWFITINPKPEFDKNWEPVFDTVCAFIKGHCYLKEGLVAVEQRGTASVHGVHYHILISKHNIKKYRLKEHLKVFEEFCDPHTKFGYSKVINMKEKDIDYLQDKINYIKGAKLDSDKPEKVAYDKIWRNKVGLEDYYDFDSLPTRISKSLRGGARKGSGVKLGTKRGPYNKKKKVEKTTQSVCDPKGSKLVTEVTTLVTF